MAMNKNGFMMELIAFIVIGIISVLLFVGFIYGFGLINGVLSSGELDSSAANVSQASNASFGYLNTGLQQLHLIAAILLIGYAMATLIFAYMSSKHQLWMFVYILMTIIIVIFSIYVSNAYETISSNETLGSTIAGFGIVNLIMANLPIWASVIGLFGIVLCLVGGYVRRQDLG